jgi:hypothetical protein
MSYQPQVGDVYLINGKLQTVTAVSGPQVTLEDPSGVLTSTWISSAARLVSSPSGAALFTTSAGEGNGGTGAVSSTAVNQAGAFVAANGPYTITFTQQSYTDGTSGLSWAVTDTHGNPIPSFSTEVLAGPNEIVWQQFSIQLTQEPTNGETASTLTEPFAGPTNDYQITWGASSGEFQYCTAQLTNGETTVPWDFPFPANPGVTEFTASGETIVSPPFEAPQVIQFLGISITISGAPASGDTFIIAPVA